MRSEHAFDLDLPIIGDDFRPISLSGTETIQRPYRFLATISVPTDKVHLLAVDDSPLRTTATLDTPSGPRLFHGLVDQSHVVATETSGGNSTVTLRLVPHFALLKHKRQSRIFQHATTRQIIETLFRDMGILSRFDLSAELRERTYCCQYRESDLAFVHRILAEDGIFYWFEHPSEGPEVMTFGDADASYRPIRGNPQLSMAPPGAGNALRLEEYHVLEAASQSRVRTKTALRRGYDMTRRFFNARELSGRGEAEPGPPDLGDEHRPLVRNQLTHDDHLGSREETRTLDSGAPRYLDGLRADARTVESSSLCRRLEVAHTLSVDWLAHGNDPNLVVTEVRHQIRQPDLAQGRPTYENKFTAVPQSTPIRPRRRDTRPTATCETAFVVGPKGQEIYTDEFGRVKVQFHWDLDGVNDEHSSTWLRVGQPWAGAGFGAQFLPRIGMEVLVTFVGGDPDRPLVSAVLHNSAAPTPFSFPRERSYSGIKTRTVPGGGAGHELVFGDDSGAEFLSLRSSGTLAMHATTQGELVAGDTLTIAAGGNRLEKTAGDSVTQVGGNRIDSTTGNQTEDIGADVSVAIGGSRTLEVSGVDRQQFGAGQRHVIAGFREVLIGAKDGEMGGDLLSVVGPLSMESTKDLVLASAKTIRLRCGDTSIHLLPDRIVLDAAIIQIQGNERISLVQGEPPGAALNLQGNATLSGGTVLVAGGGPQGAGAFLQLDDNAELDGSHVNLGHSKKGAGGTRQKIGEKGVATIRVRKDWFPENVTSVVVTLVDPAGEKIERTCAPGGTIQLPGNDGESYTIVGMRAGAQSIPIHDVSDIPALVKKEQD